MTELPRHSVSVTAVPIDDQGRALLVQRRDNQRWEPPGGILELDETIEAGAAREAYEETGVTVEVEQLTGVYKNLRLGVVALVFRARAIAGDPHPTPEARDVQWLTRDEVIAQVPGVYAIRVLDAMDAANRVSIRHHDGTHLQSLAATTISDDIA